MWTINSWQETYHLFDFFQPEDGIRAHCVTGLQTCCLPISGRSRFPRWPLGTRRPRRTRWATPRPTEHDVIRSQTRGCESRLADAVDRSARRHIASEQSEIGRASCRERVEIEVDSGSTKSTQ